MDGSKPSRLPAEFTSTSAPRIVDVHHGHIPTIPVDHAVPKWQHGAEEHATDVRPVMPVVARALDDDAFTAAELDEMAALTVAELHGRNLDRCADHMQRVIDERDQLRTELSADRKAIGVLGAAVGKVGDLHQADEDGFCRACQTTLWPCATAKAIGAGQ